MLFSSRDVYKRIATFTRKSSSFFRRSFEPLRVKHSCIAFNAISRCIQSLCEPFSSIRARYFSRACCVSCPEAIIGYASFGYSSISILQMLTFFASSPIFSTPGFSWVSEIFSQTTSLTLLGKLAKSDWTTAPVYF